MAEDVMLVEWVIGRAIGDRAKSILDHAHAGLGYQILEQGKQGNQQFCLYAFRRACDSPVPEHLTVVVDPFMLKKLNDREDARHGTHNQKPSKPASSKKVAEIRSLFDKPRQPAAVDYSQPAKDRD